MCPKLRHNSPAQTEEIIKCMHRTVAETRIIIVRALANIQAYEAMELMHITIE